MKTMTCNQLGGACDQEFHADTFEEMAQLSQKHGMEMAEKGDPDHLAAMESTKQLMQDPDTMQKWMEDRRQEFDSLPEDN